MAMARNNRPRASEEVAAAAALVGAAAVGGKFAWDTRAGSKRDAEQAFRLYQEEAIPDGIRRIARGQLDRAHDELRAAPKRKLGGAVHDTRKAFKRLRATVRLARGGIGDDTYRRENTAFRDAGRRLSGVRDASVLIETLNELEKASGDVFPTGATAGLRARLEYERKRALDSLHGDDALVAAVIGDIDQARTRTAAWTFETRTFDALEPGLRRIYRRGRKAMQRAQADPTNENLHEWRKRVKDLWHAEQILRPAAPKKMKKLAKRTHALADLLGDDHDLAELRLYVGRHRRGFNDRMAQVALLAVIERRRKELQRRAFRLGPQLYRRRPKRFVKAVGRAGRKRSWAQGGAAAKPNRMASVGREIERKFLVDGDVPLDPDDGESISQGYISIGADGSEVRLRAKGGKRTLGVKSGPARTRVEEEIELDRRCFESLWPLTEGRRIEKRRFVIPADGDLEIELDVYDGKLSGLIMAEVEFPSERDADEFQPPAWLGTDVTGDARYSNQSLAGRASPRRR